MDSLQTHPIQITRPGSLKTSALDPRQPKGKHKHQQQDQQKQSQHQDQETEPSEVPISTAKDQGTSVHPPVFIYSKQSVINRTHPKRKRRPKNHKTIDTRI